MVANRLSKLSELDRRKRQKLLDEFYGTEKNEGEDGLWDKENTLRTEIFDKLEEQGIEIERNSIGNKILPNNSKTKEYKKVEKRINEINKILEKDFGEFIITFGKGTTGEPSGLTKTEYDLIT